VILQNRFPESSGRLGSPFLSNRFGGNFELGDGLGTTTMADEVLDGRRRFGSGCRPPSVGIGSRAFGLAGIGLPWRSLCPRYIQDV